MKLRVCLYLLVLGGCCAHAEPGYSISGQVLISEKGNIHIYLVDEQQFSIPFSGIAEIVSVIMPEQLDSGSVSFAFANIPVGEYGLRVFVDTNANGKLDRGLFGPTEPWGMSWQGKRSSRIPKFEDTAFTLTGDIEDLTIDSRRK